MTVARLVNCITFENDEHQTEVKPGEKRSTAEVRNRCVTVTVTVTVTAVCFLPDGRAERRPSHFVVSIKTH